MKRGNKQRKEFYFLILIFLAYFIIRLFVQKYNVIINGDGAYYVNLAKNLVEGNGLITDYLIFIPFKEVLIPHYDLYSPPLFSILIAISYKIFGISFLSAKIVPLFFGSLLVFPLYYLGKELFDKRVALFAALLGMFNVYLTVVYNIVVNHIVFVFFNTLTVLLFVRCLKYNRLKDFVLVGILIGLSFLLRFQAMFLIPLFIIAYLIMTKNPDFYKNKKLWAMILSFFVIISPWMVRNHDFTGNPFYMEKTDIVKYEHTDEEAYEEYLFDIHAQPSSLFEFIFSNPFLFFVSGIKSIIHLLLSTPIITQPLVFLFGIFGIYSSFKKYRKFILMYLIILFYYLFFGFIHGLQEYLLPLVPFFIIFAAHGIIEFAKRFKKNKDGLSNLILIFLVLISFVGTIGATFVWHLNEPLEAKETGLWLKENTSPDDVIMSRKTYHAYYSDTRWVPLPVGGFENIMELAEKYNVKYIIFDERKAAKVRPELKFLLTKENIPENLELIYESNGSNNYIDYKIWNIKFMIETNKYQKVLVYEIVEY